MGARDETQGMLLRHRPAKLGSQPDIPAPGFVHVGRSAVILLRWLAANRVQHVLVGPVGEAIRGLSVSLDAGEPGVPGTVAIVPAPYGRNVERLCRALTAAHARVRLETLGETRPVKLSEEKLLRGGRWALRCGPHDLDIEGCPRGAARYQELVYEASSFEPASGLLVEVASPEDLAYYAHLRATGSPPEIRVARATRQHLGA